MRKLTLVFSALFFFAFVSGKASSGSSSGTVSSAKDKIMNGEEMTLDERVALMSYIQDLEKPIVVGTGVDTVIVREGRVFRSGDVRLQQNEVIVGHDALEVLKK